MKYIYCFVIGILLYLLLNSNENFRKLEKFTISAPVDKVVVPGPTVKLEPSGGIVEHGFDTCLGPGCPQEYDVALDDSDVPVSDVPVSDVPVSGEMVETRHYTQLESALIRAGLKDIADTIGNHLFDLDIKNLSDIPELFEELPGPGTAGTAAAGVQEPRDGDKADKIIELYDKLNSQQQVDLRTFLQQQRSELERALIEADLKDIADTIGNDLYNLDIKNLSDIPDFYDEIPGRVQEPNPIRGRVDAVKLLYDKLSSLQQSRLRNFLATEEKKLVKAQKPVADYTQLDNTLVMANLKDIVDRFYEVSESDKSIKDLSELGIHNLHDLIAFRHHDWKEEANPIKLNQHKEFLILYNSLDKPQGTRLINFLDSKDSEFEYEKGYMK